MASKVRAFVMFGGIAMNEIIEQATSWYIHGPRWQVFILALPVACLCVYAARKLWNWWRGRKVVVQDADIKVAPWPKPIAPGTPYGSAPDESGRPVTWAEHEKLVADHLAHARVNAELAKVMQKWVTKVDVTLDLAETDSGRPSALARLEARIAALEAAQKPAPADEYEPVGTLPIVGDRVRWKWRDEPFDGIATEVIGDDGCAMTKGTVQVRCARTMEHWRFALDQVTGGVMFRILKRAPAQPGVLIDGAWWRGFRGSCEGNVYLHREGRSAAFGYANGDWVGSGGSYCDADHPKESELPADHVRQLHAEAKKAGVV